MDARIAKLGKLLEDNDLAATLVASGLDTPRKIRATKKADLEKIKGIGSATSGRIKAKFGG